MTVQTRSKCIESTLAVVLSIPERGIDFVVSGRPIDTDSKPSPELWLYGSRRELGRLPLLGDFGLLQILPESTE